MVDLHHYLFLFALSPSEELLTGLKDLKGETNEV